MEEFGGRSMRVSASMRAEIVDHLEAAIVEGRLKPGQRLNERSLSELLGVSRPPLREAIRQLEAEGLVTSLPRRGSYVRIFTGDEIREIYSLRYAIEAAAAEDVSLANRSEDLRELKERLSRIESLASSAPASKSVLETDLMFHREIVVRSRSDRLLKAWDILARELQLALLFVDPEFYNFAFVEETHRPLFEAIKNRDLAGVRHWTRELKRAGDSIGRRWDSENMSSELAALSVEHGGS